MKKTEKLTKKFPPLTRRMMREATREGALAAKKLKARKVRRHVRIQLEYVLDLGRSFFEGPHEIAGLKNDVGGLIVRGLLHVNPGIRLRYELGDIKLVPASIKFTATPCDRRGR